MYLHPRPAYVCLVAVCLLVVTTAPAIAGISAPFQILTNRKNVIVWQEFHPWLMITEDQTAGRECYFYNYSTASKMTFKTPMAGSWMPLGSAIKWLMWVGAYQGLDRLVAHDVDIHRDYIAWPSMQAQVGCGMTGEKCVFGQYRDSMVRDHYPVDLYDYDVRSGSCQASCVSDSEKSQFAHDGSLLVYRAYFGPGDARIQGHYFSSTGEFEIADRNGTSPSVCGSLVAWAETNGLGYNIVAKDISTGELRTIAYTTANPPLPQAGRGAIFWQDARNASTGLDIYGYDWQARQDYPVTTASGDQFRLRVCDDLVTWVTGTASYQILWGALIGPYANFTGVVSGITSTGTFYCQKQPGVGAVKVVLKSGQTTPSVGQKVSASGTWSEDPLYLGQLITEATVTLQGTSALVPVAMANSSIGVTNAWMLVKSWGRVSGLSVGGGCRFNMTDGATGTSVYVTSPFAAPTGLANGAYVCVEGISRTLRTTGRQIEVVTDGKLRIW